LSISGQKNVENIRSQVKSFINLLKRELKAENVVPYAAITYDWNIKKDGAEKNSGHRNLLSGARGFKYKIKYKKGNW